MKLQLTITIDESELAKIWQPKYLKELLKFDEKDLGWWAGTWLIKGFPNADDMLIPYMDIDIKEVKE